MRVVGNGAITLRFRSKLGNRKRHANRTIHTDLPGTSSSRERLAAAGGRVCGRVDRTGVRRGDSMALWPQLPGVDLSASRGHGLGVATVAVNTRFRSAEVADIVGRSEARALVYWPGFLGIDFDGILEDVDDAALSRVEHVLVYGEGEGAQTLKDGARQTDADLRLCATMALACRPSGRARKRMMVACVYRNHWGTQTGVTCVHPEARSGVRRLRL